MTTTYKIPLNAPAGTEGKQEVPTGMTIEDILKTTIAAVIEETERELQNKLEIAVNALERISKGEQDAFDISDAALAAIAAAEKGSDEKI